MEFAKTRRAQVNLNDSQGLKAELYYLRDREKREVDFLTCIDGKLEYLIEVKTSDDQFSPSLRYFSERLSGGQAIQLVLNLPKESRNSYGQVSQAAQWLGNLEV